MEILELNGRVRMDQPIYRETVFCRGQKHINRAVPCVSICFLFIYVSPQCTCTLEFSDIQNDGFVKVVSFKLQLR